MRESLPPRVVVEDKEDLASKFAWKFRPDGEKESTPPIIYSQEENVGWYPSSTSATGHEALYESVQYEQPRVESHTDRPWFRGLGEP